MWDWRDGLQRRLEEARHAWLAGAAALIAAYLMVVREGLGEDPVLFVVPLGIIAVVAAAGLEMSRDRYHETRGVSRWLDAVEILALAPFLVAIVLSIAGAAMHAATLGERGVSFTGRAMESAIIGFAVVPFAIALVAAGVMVGRLRGASWDPWVWLAPWLLGLPLVAAVAVLPGDGEGDVLGILLVAASLPVPLLLARIWEAHATPDDHPS